MQSGCSYKTLNCYESETAFEAIIRVSRTFRFLRVSSPPHPALPCPAPTLFYPLRSTGRSSSSSTLALFSVIGPPKIKSSFVSLPFLLALLLVPPPLALIAPCFRLEYTNARASSPREVFKREKGAPTRELKRNTPRELPIKRPAKRVDLLNG